MFYTKGIVLNREDFSESDRYVEFLTQDWGIITVIAKAAKKSQRRYIGGLDLFCHDEICLKHPPQGRSYLIELSVINSFMGLRESIERVQQASKFVQWIRRLCERESPLPQVYSLLGQSLSLLEKERFERLNLLNFVFKWKLLELLGILPEVSECLECNEKNPEEGFFSEIRGGILCRPCFRKNPQLQITEVSQELVFLRDLTEFKLVHWEQLVFSDRKLLFLNQLVTQFVGFQTHLRVPL